MKLPHLRSEQIKNQPDQTAALINRLVDEVEKKGDGGGGGGTNDFDQLINRPSYNGTTMTGNTNIPAVPTKTSQLNNDSGFVNNTDLTNAISNHNTSGTAHSDIRNSITSLSNSVTAIQNVIPTAATANNKLTDKNYVDDSINSVTAYYITKNAAGDAFATKAELNSATVFYSGGVVRIPTRNDYCIVEADESKRDPITGEDPTTRYIYNNGWEFQYIVNKTALTADQLAALNSGVTAADVTKLSGIEAGAEVNVQADWTEADNTSDAYIKNKPTIGDATLTITQNGTSVGTFTANATSDVTLALTDTLYNDFTGATNITAGAHGLVIAPAAGDQMKALYGDGTWKLAHMTIAAYGKSTYAEILAAYKANNIIYCRASSNANPGTGNQLRMAFLAYVNNEATPTEFEFQYYRSVATHTDSQQGDQVYVYKINSSGTWSVTVRSAFTKVAAGTNMSSSYSSGTITLNATDTTYSAGNGLSLTGTTFEIDPSVVAEVSDIPTKTSDLANDGSDGTSTYVEADDLATVATSGSYIDLFDKPTIPVVNDATLTITQNGTTAGTFTANSNTPTTVALTDTTYSDFEGATSSIAGSAGLVPAPTTSDPDKFLKGDGTWDTPTDTTYSDFTGATSGAAGTSGLVPQPAAGDDTKFLSGDGTWQTVSASGARTEFCWGSMPDNTMKDSTDTNTVTGQDVYDACELGQVIIKSRNPKPDHYDEVVSYQYYQSIYRFVVTYKDFSDSKHDMREYVYESGSWSSNTITLQNELSNATTVTDGTMSAADKTNLDNLVNGFAGKVDVASENLDDYSGTLAAKVQSIYPAGYHRWYTTTNGSVANITDKPTTGNVGFVLEAFLERDNNSTDWAYKVVCYTSYDDNQNYVGYVRNNTSSITWEKLIDTASVGEVTPTMLENSDYYDMLGPIYGTAIPNSANLNTLAYLNVGMYSCNTNVIAATLTNCPTTSAFTMRVYSSHSPSVQDPATDTWVYLVREITDLSGHRWIQNANSGSTAGTFTYGTWKRCLESDQVLSASAVRDAGWNADKDYIPDMSMIAYWNGASSGTSSNLKYFANNSVTYNNLVKPASGDYWTKPASINGSGVIEAGKYIDFHNTAASANNYDVRLQVNSAGQTTVTIPNKTGTMALTSDFNASTDVLSAAITAASGYTITGSMRKLGCMIFMNIIVKKNSGNFGTGQEGVATLATGYRPVAGQVNTYCSLSSSEWDSNKSLGYAYVAGTIYVKDANASGSNWAKINVAYTTA